MKIESLSNSKIKDVSKLKIKKYRDLNKKFIVEGSHLVYEAYKHGYLLEIYSLVTDNYLDIDVLKYEVTSEIMNKLSDQVTKTDVIGVCKYIDEEINDNYNYLLLDGIQDPGNLGTIIRSAAAFNFNVILGDNTVDIYNSKTIRSTEGMIFVTKFKKCNLVEFYNNNLDLNYYIADMNKGNNVKDLKLNNSVAVIMGNEGNGISDTIRNLNLNYLFVNQNKLCESLNVGVAASIIMHELGDIK